MLQAGTVLQSRYRIDRLIGEGGMGRVYLATHLKIHRPVAVKELRRMSNDPRQQREYVEQFEAEARILSSLDHPHVVRVLDFFEEFGNPYLVLEFIQGRTLEGVMDLAPRALTQKKVLEWADQLLGALEYLHGRTPPIVVKDLNPRNLMLDAEARLKIIDFGLAKLMGPGGGTREIVRSMGSEGYAPLEQYGQRPTDQRSDLYALAATLLFLLTKAPPPAPPVRLMQGQALPDPRTVNPTVTEPVWQALQKMLAVEPEGRPSSAAECRRLLGLDKPAAPPKAAPARGRDPKARPCPDCAIPLRPVTRMGVEIDLCPRCQGLWLDRGELERLMERSRHSSGRVGQQPPRPGQPLRPARQKPKGFLERVLDYLED